MALLVCAGCLKAHSEQRNEQAVAVATVSGEPVYAEAFRKVYVDYLLKTGLKDEQINRTRVLNALIDEFVLVQDARKAGVEEEAGYLAAQGRHRSKLLIEAYVKEALFDTLQISEDALKDMFVRANTTLAARHLYARTKDQAEALHKRLENGASFEDLAREVFADTALANHGGYVGEFTLDDMDLAFEEAAYALEVGETSRPVKTATGYSIIKLEGRFVKPLITEYEFAERRDRMEHFVSYRKKIAARTTHVSRLIEKMNLSFREGPMNRLTDQITGFGPASNEEVERDGRGVLATYTVDGKTQTLDVATFRALAESASEEQRAAVDDRESLEQFIKGLLAREEMIRRAEAMQLDKSPAFIQAQDNTNRAWIRDFVSAAMLRDVIVPEDSVRQYYAQHRDEFNAAPAYRVWEILVDSKVRADSLLEALKTTSFQKLAKGYSLRPGADEAGGDLGYLAPEQLGLLHEHVRAAKETEVLGPLELKGYYVLLKVGDHRPARQLSYEEARSEILDRKRRAAGRRNLRQHIQVLRSQSQISIDHALLSDLPLKSELSLTEEK